MKLTYWVAVCLDDHKCYNVRARTKREAQALLDERSAESYGPLHKVTVEYASAFELVNESLSEDGGYWEH
jgi:hypothetical protein